jgi:hypothetical protein
MTQLLRTWPRHLRDSTLHWSRESLTFLPEVLGIISSPPPEENKNKQTNKRGCVGGGDSYNINGSTLLLEVKRPKQFTKGPWSKAALGSREKSIGRKYRVEGRISR